MATIGNRVIHPGGRASTRALLARARITATSQVLDVGCGVATTAVEIARRHGARVTAVDISPLMLERAEANVRAAHLDGRVTARGDICALPFGDNSFDVVIAEVVTMFADRPARPANWRGSAPLAGRCWPPNFAGAPPPPEQARQVFLGQVCPGMVFDTVDDWAQLRSSAGLVGVETQTGPFEVMTPRGFLADEGPAHNLTIMTRVASRPANNRKMARLMPRMAKAVPYLGYVLGGQRKAAVIIVGQPHDRTVIARSARRGEPPSRRR